MSWDSIYWCGSFTCIKDKFTSDEFEIRVRSKWIKSGSSWYYTLWSKWNGEKDYEQHGD